MTKQRGKSYGILLEGVLITYVEGSVNAVDALNRYLAMPDGAGSTVGSHVVVECVVSHKSDESGVTYMCSVIGGKPNQIVSFDAVRSSMLKKR